MKKYRPRTELRKALYELKIGDSTIIHCLPYERASTIRNIRFFQTDMRCHYDRPIKLFISLVPQGIQVERGKDIEYVRF